MSEYFVLGLPRSRTAWLSVFLSQSGQFCHHDGINGCDSIQAYRDKIAGCGDATTGFAVVDIEKLYPDAPKVIIEKSRVELQYSIEWANRTYQIDCTQTLTDQYGRLMGLSGIKMAQSEIDQNLPLIFETLTGEPYKNRYGRIKKMNIQVDPFAIDLISAEKLLNASV